MNVERCYDTKAIYSAVIPMIDDVTEDNTGANCFNLDVDSDCWLSLSDDDGLCGYMHVLAYNRTTLDIHPYILKSRRNTSKDCGLAALGWIAKEAPEMYRKVISQVPSIYPHIKRYTKNLGFTHEGTYTKSFIKNGKLHDLWLFGIERKDIK